MITWPIFLALALAFVATRYTIKMEEKKERENEENQQKESNTSE